MKMNERDLVDAWAGKLFQVRCRLRLSQLQVAAAVGVSRVTLHHWEAGHRSPSSEHLIAWARALGWEVVLRRPEDEGV